MSPGKRAKTKHEPSKKIEQHNAIGVFTKTVSKMIFVKFGVVDQGRNFFQIKHKNQESIFHKETIFFICFLPWKMGKRAQR